MPGVLQGTGDRKKVKERQNSCAPRACGPVAERDINPHPCLFSVLSRMPWQEGRVFRPFGGVTQMDNSVPLRIESLVL